MKINVLNRWTGNVQFTAEIDCDESLSPRLKMGLAVKWAFKSDADLSGAVLRSFKADMWMTLTENLGEVLALIKALRDGNVDGSQYEGECSCLVGTIAKAKGVDYHKLNYNSNNPAERWFMMIRRGDKPGDDTGGSFAAKMALEWAEEFCALHGITVPTAEDSHVL